MIEPAHPKLLHVLAHLCNRVLLAATEQHVHELSRRQQPANEPGGQPTAKAGRS